MRTSISTIALISIACFLPANPAAAAGRKSGGADLEVGALIGAGIPTLRGGYTMFRLRADGSMGLMNIAEKLKLHGVVSLGVGTGGTQTTLFSVTTKTTILNLELVPAARVNFALLKQLDLHADVGLGLGLWNTHEKTSSSSFIQKNDFTDAAISMRIRVGAGWAVNDELKVRAELMDLGLYFTSNIGAFYGFFIGATYAL